MSEDKLPEAPSAVFKCKDKNCTKPHYHLDPQVEKNISIEQETEWDDRPIVEIKEDEEK